MRKSTNENELTVKDVMFYSSVLKNPVLIQAIGLCPVVAIATSLKTALILAGIMTVLLVITEVIASAILKKIPRWIRVIIYAFLGVAIVAPIMFVFEKYADVYMSSLGIYLPLLAVNSLIVLQCENVAMKTTVKQSFIDAVSSSFGYGIVLAVVGVIREVLGNGTIWGSPIAEGFAAKGLLMPFGGFLIIGFMAAALKWFFSKRYPDYAEQLETNSRVTIEKRKLDPRRSTTRRRSRSSKKLPVLNDDRNDEFYVAKMNTVVKTIATTIENEEPVKPIEEEKPEKPKATKEKKETPKEKKETTKEKSVSKEPQKKKAPAKKTASEKKESPEEKLSYKEKKTVENEKKKEKEKQARKEAAQKRFDEQKAKGKKSDEYSELLSAIPKKDDTSKKERDDK